MTESIIHFHYYFFSICQRAHGLTRDKVRVRGRKHPQGGVVIPQSLLFHFSILTGFGAYTHVCHTFQVARAEIQTSSQPYRIWHTEPLGHRAITIIHFYIILARQA